MKERKPVAKLKGSLSLDLGFSIRTCREDLFLRMDSMTRSDGLVSSIKK